MADEQKEYVFGGLVIFPIVLKRGDRLIEAELRLPSDVNKHDAERVKAYVDALVGLPDEAKS